MAMQFDQILPPPPEPPPRDKAEGTLRDVETLAMLLAVSTNVRNPPQSRIEIHEQWMDRDEEERVGYLRRARRLLKAWSS
jgi:hypothetical protein